MYMIACCVALSSLCYFVQLEGRLLRGGPERDGHDLGETYVMLC